jgi:hypothetical protein
MNETDEAKTNGQPITAEQIVQAIRGIDAAGNKPTASRMLEWLGRPASDFRVIDRALQRERKKGLIQFHQARGWRLSD